MNILLIHQAFVGPNDPGGTRHYELGRHLVGQGHQFTIVASDISHLTGNESAVRHGLFSVEMLDGIRVLRTYIYRSLHRSFVWRVVAFLSFMVSSLWPGLRAGPIDIVIGTTPPIFQTISAWLIAGLRRRPFLLEVRDLWPEFAIEMGVLRNPVLIRLSRWLERFLYARATHIVVNSPAYRDYLLKKGVASSKVDLVANGVDPVMFESSNGRGKFREAWKVDGKFVVVYAGALGMANDIPTLFRAAARLRQRQNIVFVLVGDGKERPNLEKEAEANHLQNVLFAGSYPKHAMPDILAAADACLAILQDIPMFATTYPNKVFDYMASGKPTILVIDGVIREVIEKAKGGIFVRPGDDAALAETVDSLSRDEASVSAMGRAARDYVRAHFNRQQQARHFNDLLQRLVD